MNCVGSGLMVSFGMQEWLGLIVQAVVVPLAALMATTWLARIAIRRRCLMLLWGFVLLAWGCATYSGKGDFLEPLCNAMSAFFPSRGEYSWPSSTGTNSAAACFMGYST